MQTLRKNWLWIAAPIVIFAIVVAAIVLFGPDGQDPNVYRHL